MQRLEATAEALSGADTVMTPWPSKSYSDSCDLLTVETAKDVKTGRPLGVFFHYLFLQLNLLIL